MNLLLPTLYLARHGETAWSLTGQHTGLTDLPLTERGERTLKAFADHGEVDLKLPADGGDCDAVLRQFENDGVHVDTLAAQLQDEGANSFVKSWKELLAVISSKSAALQHAA